MKFIQGIVDGFIMTVGITQPKPEKRLTATIFIATGILGTVLIIVALFLFAVTQVLRR
jgi:hypothetical protein